MPDETNLVKLLEDAAQKLKQSDVEKKELETKLVAKQAENAALFRDITSFGTHRKKLLTMDEIAKAFGDKQEYLEQLMKENPLEFIKHCVRKAEAREDISIRQMRDLQVGLDGSTVFKRFAVFRKNWSGKQVPKDIQDVIYATQDMERLWRHTIDFNYVVNAKGDAIIRALDFAIESKGFKVSANEKEIEKPITTEVREVVAEAKPENEAEEEPEEKIEEG